MINYFLEITKIPSNGLIQPGVKKKSNNLCNVNKLSVQLGGIALWLRAWIPEPDQLGSKPAYATY